MAAYELTTRFIAQHAETEEEAREELALFLANTPLNLIADGAEVRPLDELQRVTDMRYEDPLPFDAAADAFAEPF